MSGASRLFWEKQRELKKKYGDLVIYMIPALALYWLQQHSEITAGQMDMSSDWRVDEYIARPEL